MVPRSTFFAGSLNVLGNENRVTVALPVYNGMPFLKEALDSVLTQSHSDLDVVVIDNCSTDGSADYVRSIGDPRITVLANDTNIGLMGNWNKALEQAQRSPFFKLMCADDFLEHDAIKTELEAMTKHPEVVMTAAQRSVVDVNGKTMIKARGLSRLSDVVSGPRAIRATVRSGTNIFGEPPSVLLRSSVFPAAGTFVDTNYYCIDLDLWTRVLAHGDLFAIRKPLARFRVSSGSTSVELARKQRSQSIAELKELRARPGTSVSSLDLWIGIAAATVLSQARIAFYKINGRKKQA